MIDLSITSNRKGFIMSDFEHFAISYADAIALTRISERELIDQLEIADLGMAIDTAKHFFEMIRGVIENVRWIDNWAFDGMMNAPYFVDMLTSREILDMSIADMQNEYFRMITEMRIIMQNRVINNI